MWRTSPSALKNNTIVLVLAYFSLENAFEKIVIMMMWKASARLPFPNPCSSFFSARMYTWAPGLFTLQDNAARAVGLTKSDNPHIEQSYILWRRSLLKVAKVSEAMGGGGSMVSYLVALGEGILIVPGTSYWATSPLVNTVYNFYLTNDPVDKLPGVCVLPHVSLPEGYYCKMALLEGIPFVQWPNEVFKLRVSHSIEYIMGGHGWSLTLTVFPSIFLISLNACLALVKTKAMSRIHALEPLVYVLWSISAAFLVFQSLYNMAVDQRANVGHGVGLRFLFFSLKFLIKIPFKGVFSLPHFNKFVIWFN